MRMDPFIFAAGVVRIGIWSYGAYLAFKARRPIGFAGFTLAALTSIVFSISNAHGTVPMWLMDGSSVFSTPIAALMVGSFFNMSLAYTRERDKCVACPLLANEACKSCSHSSF